MHGSVRHIVNMQSLLNEYDTQNKYLNKQLLTLLQENKTLKIQKIRNSMARTLTEEGYGEGHSWKKKIDQERERKLKDKYGLKNQTISKFKVVKGEENKQTINAKSQDIHSPSRIKEKDIQEAKQQVFQQLQQPKTNQTKQPVIEQKEKNIKEREGIQYSFGDNTGRTNKQQQLHVNKQQQLHVNKQQQPHVNKQQQPKVNEEIGMQTKLTPDKPKHQSNSPQHQKIQNIKQVNSQYLNSTNIFANSQDLFNRSTQKKRTQTKQRRRNSISHTIPPSPPIDASLKHFRSEKQLSIQKLKNSQSRARSKKRFIDVVVSKFISPHQVKKNNICC